MIDKIIKLMNHSHAKTGNDLHHRDIIPLNDDDLSDMSYDVIRQFCDTKQAVLFGQNDTLVILVHCIKIFNF